MLNKAPRDMNAFPSSQTTINAHVSNANQTNEDTSFFIPVQPCENPPASTPNQQSSDLSPPPAKRNGNTTASMPYQSTANYQNTPETASIISPIRHASQRNQTFMTSPPHSHQIHQPTSQSKRKRSRISDSDHHKQLQKWKKRTALKLLNSVASHANSA